jgi:phosphatidylglycerol:prolipoprotein diacylglycerol transferase
MFTISNVHEVNWYELLYLISSVLTYLFLCYLGWKKGYPMLSWILILVTGALFFIVGTKLFTFRSEEWTMLFREGIFPRTSGKSAIGGLLFAILGVELSRSWLKIKEFVLDTYVLMVPLGLAIQKPGCIIAGCCYGNPTSLPWGVQYTQGTAAHYHHWISNSIPTDALFSLPVHPVPIYEMLSYLLIFGTLILLAPYLQKRGSRFLLALTLLAISRFTLEFFRDPAATVAMGKMIGGLKAMQWLMLVMGLVCGSLLLRKLNRPTVLMNDLIQPDALTGRKFILILVLSLLMWAVHKGFSPTEMLVMNLKLAPALVLFGIHTWIRFTVPRFRLAGIFILIIPLLIMGQSVPGKETDWKYFHSFGLGGTFGSYGQVARYDEHEGYCGPAYSVNYYDHNYGMTTLNYQYTKQSGFTSQTYGGTLFGGITTETEINKQGTTKHFTLGIHPYINYDSRWVGFGFGIGIGNLNYIPTAPFDERSINTGMKTFPVLPSARLRVGPYDIIDLEYKFLDDFPTQFPVVTHQISLGSGFGMENGSGLRIGVAPPEANFFISANLLINNKFMLQAKYMYTDFIYGNSNFVSFGLNYRLIAHPKTVADSENP